MIRRLLCLIVLAGLAAGPAAAQRRDDAGLSLAGVGHDLGGTNARVFIVEFGDFGCGYCAKFAKETYPRIDSAYIRPGLVRWKMVPFVTGMFRNSREVAEAAECAGEQGAFWKMHDLLYARRKDWMASRNIRALVGRYAAELKLNPVVFSQCTLNPQVRRRIQVNDALAQRLAIRGTPTFFVTGRTARLIPGAVPFELFKQAIDEVSR